jgi:hypothetical protein
VVRESKAGQSLPSPPADAIYSGGDGTTVVKAVAINLSSDSAAVHAEYSWLSQRCPSLGLKTAGLMAIGEKHYDSTEIVLPDGSERTYYFDISKSF